MQPIHFVYIFPRPLTTKLLDACIDMILKYNLGRLPVTVPEEGIVIWSSPAVAPEEEFKLCQKVGNLSRKLLLGRLRVQKIHTDKQRRVLMIMFQKFENQKI